MLMKPFLKVLVVAIIGQFWIISASAQNCQKEIDEYFALRLEAEKISCGGSWGRNQMCTEQEQKRLTQRGIDMTLDDLRKLTDDQRRAALPSWSAELQKQVARGAPKAHIADLRMTVCLFGGNSGSSSSTTASLSGSNQGGRPISGSSNSQSTTAPLNTSNQSQQLQASAQQAQATAVNVQQRADADAQRRGRRVHDPAAEAHDCLEVDFTGLFGAMKNKCSYKVHYVFCAFKPRDEKALNSGWLTGLNCENHKFGADFISPNSSTAQHTKGTERIHYFACKDPAWAVDYSFEGGEIKGRCRNVGGN